MFVFGSFLKQKLYDYIWFYDININVKNIFMMLNLGYMNRNKNNEEKINNVICNCIEYMEILSVIII